MVGTWFQSIEKVRFRNQVRKIQTYSRGSSSKFLVQSYSFTNKYFSQKLWTTTRSAHFLYLARIAKISHVFIIYVHKVVGAYFHSIAKLGYRDQIRIIKIHSSGSSSKFINFSIFFHEQVFSQKLWTTTIFGHFLDFARITEISHIFTVYVHELLGASFQSIEKGGCRNQIRIVERHSSGSIRNFIISP